MDVCKNQVYEMRSELLRFVKKHHTDWFDETMIILGVGQRPTTPSSFSVKQFTRTRNGCETSYTRTQCIPQALVHEDE